MIFAGDTRHGARASVRALRALRTRGSYRTGLRCARLFYDVRERSRVLGKRRGVSFDGAVARTTRTRMALVVVTDFCLCRTVEVTLQVCV